MALLNKKLIQDLTKLSRIQCSETEEEALLVDLQKILSYIEQLNEIDTDHIEPCNQVIAGMSNVFRQDVIGEILPREDFLANAPSKSGGQIKVPPVFKS